jgi:hypothetical protein
MSQACSLGIARNLPTPFATRLFSRATFRQVLARAPAVAAAAVVAVVVVAVEEEE